jgi:hypothetical protein
VTYRYDVFGNKVQATARANASTAYTTDYAYDRLDRLTTTTYAPVETAHVEASGTVFGVVAEGAQRLAQTNVWDEAGRRVRQIGTDGKEALYRHDLRGNIIERREAGVTTRMEKRAKAARSGPANLNSALGGTPG